MLYETGLRTSSFRSSLHHNNHHPERPSLTIHMSSIPYPTTSLIRIDPSIAAFNIPLAQLQNQHQNKRLVVGVAILSTSPGSLKEGESNSDVDNKRKILLVRRSATETEFAGLYELPGGGSETDLDATILDTVVRETIEETGLKVVHTLASFNGFEYETKNGKSIQFNFLVEVEEGAGVEVKLNPEEHDAFVWVGVEDVGKLGEWGLVGDMEAVVKDALTLISER